VADDVLTKSKLSENIVKALVTVYMNYLLERGTKDAAKEYMHLDREINGPASVQALAKARGADGGKSLGMANGQVRIED
jgi:pre-mRNA-processing factor 39